MTGAPRSGSDHPRSCGVYPQRHTLAASSSGSSPLARGLHATAAAVCEAAGIIPARAGFTPRWGAPSPGGWDHPRSRGVYRRAGDTTEGPLGSSPLARGLPMPCLSQMRRCRIIPARAGFTRAVPQAPVGVHGSSPLARGLHEDARTMDPAPGIIPARAGFTADRGRVPAAARDHPRSRGVYEFPDLQAAWEAGSSPLARGLQAVARDITAAARIIPARAGFTRDHRLRRPVGPDHPRSRGVYTLPYGSVLRRQGSSPLARGLRQPAAAGTLRPGIIPARAGFTPAGERPRWRGRDHPRSRGVYRATGKPVMLYAGSSPLARGLRHRYEGASAPAPDHPRSRGVYGKLPREALRSRGSSPLARGLPERQFFQHVVEGIIPARAGFTRHEPQNDRHTQDHPRSRGVYLWVRAVSR